MGSDERAKASSLNKTLFLLGVVALLVVSAAFVALSAAMELASSGPSLQASADRIAERLSISLARPIWSIDQNSVFLTAAAEGSDLDIRYIEVVDELGDRLALLERSSATAELREAPAGTRIGEAGGPAAVAVAERDILQAGRRIGAVRVGTWNAARARLFLSRVSSFAVAGAGFAFLTIVIMLAGVSRFIVGRIHALTDIVEAFGRDGFDGRSGDASSDEIGRLSRSFNSMAGTIQEYSAGMEAAVRDRTAKLVEAEKLAFLGSLVAGVAHELNTPVGVCVTANSFLAETAIELRRGYEQGTLTASGFMDLVDRVERSTEIIDSNLKKAGELIKTFKGIGVDQLSDAEREFLLAEYLLDTVRSLGPMLRKRNVQVAVRCDPAIRLKSHPNAFYQIVSNLVMNTINHAYPDGSGGAASVSARMAEGGLELVYEDDGKGISPEDLPRIFDPFFTTGREKGNTGMGLYIVYTLVKKLGGDIEAKARPGQGAHFRILLPPSLAVA